MATTLTQLEVEKARAWFPAKRIEVSDAEQQRRWTAARKAMEERRVDALLVHGAGYQRWFCDSPGCNYALLFPRDDDMTVVVQAPWGTDVANPPGRRGVKRLLGWPNSGDAPYSRVYTADVLEKALQPYASGTIGLVGGAPYDTIEALKSRFTKATFVDADEWIDAIKVLKSDEEWELIRLSAQMHDDAMAAAIAAIQPGIRTGEVGPVAEYVVKSYGCVPGALMCGSASRGEPAHLGQNQDRRIEAGDTLTFLVECAGLGGMFTEVGRTIVIGKATDAMLEELEFAKQAQQFTCSLLKPGAPCKDVFAAYNEFMRDNGRPEENRIHCHGQGYDLVERPLIRSDESMRIEASMNITVHPDYDRNGYHSWLCDNFQIGPEGVVGRVHTLEQKIFEIG